MTASASERLRVSRERLRQVLHGIEQGAEPAAEGSSWAAAAWRQHPWRPTVTLLGDAAGLLLAPQAARHPLRLVAVAAVAGAVMAGLRPWRWVGRPLLLAAAEPLLRAGARTLGAVAAARAPLKATGSGRN